MRSRYVLAAAAALLAAPAAQAAPTLSLGSNGGTILLDFDPDGADLVNPAGNVVSPSATAALPLGGSGQFISVAPSPPGAGTPAELDLSGYGWLHSVSFIWGSADAAPGYNVLDVLDRMGGVLGTFTGGQVLALTGGPSGSQTDPLSNPIVTISFLGDEQNIGGLRFSANQVAFETDNFTLAIPEPSTWAMMILGFGLIGGALRSRRKVSVRYA